MTKDQIISTIANSNPYGVVDYESDWSERTPGEGALYGCRYCRKHDYNLSYGDKRDEKLTADFKHEGNCVWKASKDLKGSPA